MHQLIRDRANRYDAERAMIVTESYQKNEHVPPMIKRPLATLDICSRMMVQAEDFELIVGNRAKHFLGSCIYPGPSPGRFDQYTRPFLEKDLKDGR